MQVTGTRQREAWRLRQLPPVEQVAGGVWSVPVPIPDDPLRYVLSYRIEHDAGVVMVDTGWDHPDSWRALADGLSSCGIPITAVSAILVTHAHPDHHGLSAAVRERSGGWIGLHEAEDAWLATVTAPARGAGAWERFLRWCGASQAHIEEIFGYRQAADPPREMVRADRVLEHGELIDVPGLRLRALWTPGHSPGHLCFHDETHDLMLSGDHVLPRITPNISAFEQDAAPLADYLRSLEALRGIQPSEVLPAHEYRFRDLDARLATIAAHHRERLDEIARVAATGPLSTWDIAARVTWSRGWEELSGFPRQAALGEVLAHLRHLQDMGLVECVELHGVGRWGSAR